MIGRLFLGLVLSAAAASVAAAQDVLTISGAVTTRADGLPVPGAVVSLVGADVTATTDAGGRYTLPVPSSARGDRMQLRVDGLGLPPRIVDVSMSGGTATVDVALTLAFSQEVTVGSR